MNKEKEIFKARSQSLEQANKYTLKCNSLYLQEHKNMLTLPSEICWVLLSMLPLDQELIYVTQGPTSESCML